MICILFSSARRRGLGGVGGGGGGGGRVRPLPHGGGRRDWGSSCFFTQSPPHFPCAPFLLPPTPSWLQQPSGRGPSPSGRAGGTSYSTAPAFSPCLKTRNKTVCGGAGSSARRRVCTRGSGALSAPPGLVSRLLFPVCLRCVLLLFPFLRCPKRAAGVNPFPRRSFFEHQ